MFDVDVLTPLKPGHEIYPEVSSALERQGDVRIRHFVVDGAPFPGEAKFVAITRARNRAKRLGEAPFALFLDRDIVLPDNGVEFLVYALCLNPKYAALGINCQWEYRSPVAPHVGMGCLLFHRRILDRIQFRSRPDVCECYYCRLDLRRMGYCVDYIPKLRAMHLG
jgi:hypothetical protein